MASRKRENRLTNEALLITSSSGGYCTKRELASKKLPMSCPPIPRKIRRGMGFSRNLFNVFGKAKPIAVRNDGVTSPLSPLYNTRVKKSYLDQLFDIRVQVGEGCFGYVYKSVSSDDRKCYAIKYLKENAGTPASKKREIINYARIGCNDNFVRFIRAWEEHDRYYIQMEYCVMSLAAYTAEHHSFPEGQLWDILIDMLLALKHLHSNNFIHLDIKPENIMISQQGVYKLGDFGLVVNLNELKENKERVLNISEGDSKYLASEVLEGIYTTSCDVFSLGVTLLELATDLVLPPNGTLWHELRNGVFPPIFFQRVGKEMVTIIQHMMLHEYQLRPSVETLLSLNCIDRILQERKVKPRINYLANHSAMQQDPLIRTTDHNANNALNEDANIDDDGVFPLAPLDDFEKDECRCQFLKSVEKCTMKLFDDNTNNNDDDDVKASTSNTEGALSNPATVSPASSDASTPPSCNKSIVFSPMRSKERKREERVFLGRKSVKARKFELFSF